MVFADQHRAAARHRWFLYDRSHANWPGLLSFVIGLVVSVLFFCNQAKFVGYRCARCRNSVTTFFVGFLLAGGCYLLLCRSKIDAERALV